MVFIYDCKFKESVNPEKSVIFLSVQLDILHIVLCLFAGMFNS